MGSVAGGEIGRGGLDETNVRSILETMSKGELTRQAILDHATRLATQVGLEGITIGRLSSELDLSKSGLFAHFASKRGLQMGILQHAALRFVELVVKPTLTMTRGEPRVRALFDYWMKWSRSAECASGCFFVAAAAELDDRPGPARDVLVQQQKDWMEAIATVVGAAISEADFREDVDPEQFAQDLYGIMLAYHHSWRLLGDPKAAKRARNAFEALVAAAHPKNKRTE